MTKYHEQEEYQYIKDGVKRTLKFRYKLKNYVYYTENGKREKMHVKNFYSLGLEPVKQLGNMGKPKPIMTREQFKKKNSLYFTGS